MGVCGIDRRQAVFEAGLATQRLLSLVTAVRVCRSIGRDTFAVQARGKSTGRVVVGGCRGIDASAEGYRRIANRDAILAIVNSPAVGENVNVCAFGAEFTVALSSNQPHISTLALLSAPLHGSVTKEAQMMV